MNKPTKKIGKPKVKDKIFDLKRPEFSQMQMRGMRRLRTSRKDTGMMARVERKKSIKDWKKKKESFYSYGK